jgi:hypothetical protein
MYRACRGVYRRGFRGRGPLALRRRRKRLRPPDPVGEGQHPHGIFEGKPSLLTAQSTVTSLPARQPSVPPLRHCQRGHCPMRLRAASGSRAVRRGRRMLRRKSFGALERRIAQIKPRWLRRAAGRRTAAGASASPLARLAAPITGLTRGPSKAAMTMLVARSVRQARGPERGRTPGVSATCTHMAGTATTALGAEGANLETERVQVDEAFGVLLPVHAIGLEGDKVGAVERAGDRRPATVSVPAELKPHGAGNVPLDLMRPWTPRARARTRSRSRSSRVAARGVARCSTSRSRVSDSRARCAACRMVPWRLVHAARPTARFSTRLPGRCRARLNPVERLEQRHRPELLAVTATRLPRFVVDRRRPARRGGLSEFVAGTSWGSSAHGSSGSRPRRKCERGYGPGIRPLDNDGNGDVVLPRELHERGPRVEIPLAPRRDHDQLGARAAYVSSKRT